MQALHYIAQIAIFIGSSYFYYRDMLDNGYPADGMTAGASFMGATLTVLAFATATMWISRGLSALSRRRGERHEIPRKVLKR
ncbi:hypothetical protein GCM10007276_12340 [Agaricicola taiwanensis]|uniref:Uncharacterized protein n=1 Tax=Agaricicola taiwanensis TaxID=591372 RepID=A0A8J2VUX3_9RHOB|nr:hypothetical protein GCM10007276_12340 [Agaricicola taiwanensis]